MEERLLGTSHSQKEILLSIGANGLSILGAILTIPLIVSFSKLNHIFKKMIMSLSGMDLIYNCLSLLTLISAKSNFLCATLTFFTFFGFGGSIAWTCCLAHSFYNSLCNAENFRPELNWRLYTWFSLVASTTVATLTIMLKFASINPDTNVCSHSLPDEVDWSYIFVIIFPAIFGILYCSLFCFRAFCESRKYGSLNCMLLLFPSILIIWLLPMIILWAVRLFKPKDSLAPFLVISKFLRNSQGLLNALGFSLVLVCRRLLCCCCMADEDQRSDQFGIFKDTVLTMGTNNTHDEQRMRHFIERREEDEFL